MVVLMRGEESAAKQLKDFYLTLDENVRKAEQTDYPGIIHFFAGTIDEVRIYEHMLKASQLENPESLNRQASCYMPFDSIDDEQTVSIHKTKLGNSILASSAIGSALPCRTVPSEPQWPTAAWYQVRSSDSTRNPNRC